jgi:hypothetical protein
MTELNAQTTFTIEEAVTTVVESADLILLPENNGSSALRELSYPNSVFPVLQYPDNPDVTENFLDRPLTARPLVKSSLTIGDAQIARWPGYARDNPVREIWKGSDKVARMTAYFFRRFAEYFFNPPSSGYVVWTPKDMIDQPYNIELISLTVGGSMIALDHLALFHGEITGEVALSFFIVGEA